MRVPKKAWQRGLYSRRGLEECEGAGCIKGRSDAGRSRACAEALSLALLPQTRSSPRAPGTHDGEGLVRRCCYHGREVGAKLEPLYCRERKEPIQGTPNC